VSKLTASLAEIIGGGTNTGDTASTRATRIPTETETVSARPFAIGDRVRIRNPKRNQANRGVISTITASRVTVQAANGTKILRVPHIKTQIIAATPRLSTAEYSNRTVLAAKKKSIAIGFLKRADRRRYAGLWSDLENLFTRGIDQYPTDRTSAYNLLLNYKPPNGADGPPQPQS
jgi:hypothetical protein